MRAGLRLVSVVALFALVSCSMVSKTDQQKSNIDDQFSKRDFNPTIQGRWIGNGISYSPYRDGEGPDTEGLTSKEHILEDLMIIAQRWNLIRLYGADPQHRRILEVIRDNNLPIKVMQGIWLDGHQTEAENTAQVEEGIRLANEFPDIVTAVNVGNEIFVYWSWHRIEDMDGVIDQIRHVRENIKQPVTVSDDYNFWNKPEAQKVAAELDFICLHGYAIWNKQFLDNAMKWTEETYNDIQRRHPDHKIAFCETGWPTSRVSTGDSDEARLVKANVGEVEQKVFFDKYHAWVNKNKVISFYFSSFDEKWKGGFDGETPMKKMEKHWGLYKSDRSPKLAAR